MNLAEAMAIVDGGGRVTCNMLSLGTVVKLEAVGDPAKPERRVCFESSGGSFTFVPTADHEAATWHEVKGWASYG